MFESLLLEVEDRFQITGKGLVVAPTFAVPPGGTWNNFETSVLIEKVDGSKTEYEAIFWITHFNIRGSSASMENRWKIILNLPSASKTDVPIGSNIFVSDSDYKRIKKDNDA